MRLVSRGSLRINGGRAADPHPRSDPVGRKIVFSETELAQHDQGAAAPADDWAVRPCRSPMAKKPAASSRAAAIVEVRPRDVVIIDDTVHR
jgi:hypothetical protein